MKKTILMLAIALSLATASYASAQSLTDGVVTKIDASAAKITIKHGPMKKFDMDEGMTMVYRAQDPAMLQAVKAGRQDQIRRRKHQWPIRGDENSEREIACCFGQ